MGTAPALARAARRPYSLLRFAVIQACLGFSCALAADTMGCVSILCSFLWGSFPEPIHDIQT